MLLFLVPLCAGAAAGKLRGGSLTNLARLRLRAPGLVAVALGLQASLRWVPLDGRLVAVVVSYAVVGWWTLLNVSQRGLAVGIAFGLLALGWAMNLLAIAPNGGMPVSTVALRNVGAPATMQISEGNLYKHVAAGRTSPMTWLGDTIPVSPLGAVISIGDIAMALGFTVLVSSAVSKPADEVPPRKEVIPLEH